MSLETEVNEVSYNGNGSTTTGYTIPFSYLEDNDIKVYVDGVATLDFSISSGSVKTTTAHAVEKTVTIVREVALTQSLDLVPSGDLPSSLLEMALDKIVMAIQQVSRALGNTFRVPEGEDGVELPAAAARKGTWWKWDGTTGAYTGQTDAQLASAITGELALAASVSDKVTQTFSDDSDRVTSGKKPAFTGQLGVQLDTGILWRGTGTSAGNWSRVSDAVQTGATDTAKNAATPQWVGQFYYKTDDNTWWIGYATSSAGSWSQFSQAPYAAFSAPGSSAWSHGGSAVSGNYYSLTDPRSGLAQVWKCRFAHTMNDGNSGSGGTNWNGASDNRPGVYDITYSAANPSEPYLDGDEVWRNLPGADLDSGGGVFREALWEPWIQEGYHYHRLLDEPAMNKGSEFNDRYLMGEPANHTDWHIVHDWLIRNAHSNRNASVINAYAANASARDAATPGAVGQILHQADTNQLYLGTGLSAGNWTRNDEQQPGEFRRVQSGFQLTYQGGTYRTSREIKMVRHTSVLGAQAICRGDGATTIRWVSGMDATVKCIDKNLFRVAADDYKAGAPDEGSSTFFTELGNFTLDLSADDPGNGISNGIKVYLSHGSVVRPIRIEKAGWAATQGEVYAFQAGTLSDDWVAESIVINPHNDDFVDAVAAASFNDSIHGGTFAAGNTSTVTAYVTPSYSSVSDIEVYYDGVKQTYTTHWTVNGSSQVITNVAQGSGVTVHVINKAKCWDRCKTIGVDLQGQNQHCHLDTVTATYCAYAIRTSTFANGIRVGQIEVEKSDYLLHAQEGGCGTEILGIGFRRDDGQRYGDNAVLDNTTPLAKIDDIDVVNLGLRLQGCCTQHSGVAVDAARNRVLTTWDSGAAHGYTFPVGTYYLQGSGPGPGQRNRARVAFDWSLQDHAYPGYFYSIIGKDGGSKVTLNGVQIAGPIAHVDADTDAGAAGVRQHEPYIFDNGTTSTLMIKQV